MIPYVLLALWLGGHVALWLLSLRERRFWQREKAILLWHVGSCGVVGAAILLWLALSGGSLVVAVGLVALHGIYSVSFLELWALAQGSYSLSILTRTVRQGRIDAHDTRALEAIGAAKQADREADLVRLGLAERRGTGQGWLLTPRGRALCGAARGVLALARIRRAG